MDKRHCLARAAAVDGIVGGPVTQGLYRPLIKALRNDG